jgi:uncharacterized protein (DUF58 family)
MRRFASDADDRRLAAPLLDRSELMALIRLGERLARTTPAGRSASGRHGGEAARRLGEGLDFAEHRHYQPGDDIRRINWRLTARHGTPHVRRYHEDVTAPCVILLDRRASMRFGTRRRLKLAQAVRLAMVLAALHAARQADVTVLEIDHREHFLPATDSRGLAALGAHLAAPSPPLQVAEPALAEALLDLQQRIPPGALVYLLSDFADADKLSKEQWHRLARAYRLNAVSIEDPAEVAPPAADGATLYWEDGPEHLLDGALRDTLASQHAERLAELDSLLAGCAVRLQRLPSDQDELTLTVQALLQ